MKPNRREQVINVPVDDDTKSALKERAACNGRAAKREAAMILKKALAGGRR